EQRDVADDESQSPHRPHPLAADPIREMAQNDLARDAGQAHEAEGPRRVAWAETDLDQVLGLVHLHRVPGKEAGEESEHDPPEASGLYRPPQRPVHGRPGRIHDIRWPTLGFGGGE